MKKKSVSKKLSSDEKKFNKIISEIKSVKIQGANAIARAGIEAYSLFPTKIHSKKILSTRPTEPLLQNFIKILENSKDVKKTAKNLLRYMDSSQRTINRNGYNLIKNDMKIFSHCHSSSVVEMLKYAKRKGRNFTVYTTEVEPLLQGRKTARALANAGIKVIIMPDLAAEQYLQHCDIFFFGADAYSRKYIFNKIGTSTLVKIANLYNVPCYSVGFSLKFANKVVLEKRSGKEVWDERHPLIFPMNPAFSKLKGRSVNGIISESGITPYNKFVKLAKINLRNIPKQL